MKKESYKIFFISIGILIGSLIIVMLMSNWFQVTSIQFKVHGYTEENALAICSGKDLEKTSFCLNSFVKGTYHYVSTPDSERLDFDKIIEEGNDCRGWTFVYKTLFSELGFKTQRISIDVAREENTLYKHAFLIAYDKTGWCSLDQKGINCFRYAN